MGLADPGAGGGGDCDGDEMASVLECVDEGVDVGRETVRGRAIVIDDLSSRSTFTPVKCRDTRMKIRTHQDMHLEAYWRGELYACLAVFLAWDLGRAGQS